MYYKRIATQKSLASLNRPLTLKQHLCLNSSCPNPGSSGWLPCDISSRKVDHRHDKGTVFGCLRSMLAAPRSSPLVILDIDPLRCGGI